MNYERERTSSGSSFSDCDTRLVTRTVSESRGTKEKKKKKEGEQNQEGEGVGANQGLGQWRAVEGSGGEWMREAGNPRRQWIYRGDNEAEDEEETVGRVAEGEEEQEDFWTRLGYLFRVLVVANVAMAGRRWLWR
ncbi:hypothetical protein O3P69_017192 [Scylla paramamosain]|uniref:Uncharacterized protein n=1 Tax=Scylla paramamosain TaxID=85552 RepID=A0AAW0TXU6_SCYPA